jgi:vesicle transport protein SEC22
MCICDSSYPRKLAFSYLDELSKEFQRSYEGKIEGVTRPYAFMGFGELGSSLSMMLVADTSLDTFISKTTRLYKDSRSLTQGAGGSAAPASQLDQLNENLQDVTRIMTKNMEDLLWRGDSLDRKLTDIHTH